MNWATQQKLRMRSCIVCVLHYENVTAHLRQVYDLTIVARLTSSSVDHFFTWEIRMEKSLWVTVYVFYAALYVALDSSRAIRWHKIIQVRLSPEVRPVDTSGAWRTSAKLALDLSARAPSIRPFRLAAFSTNAAEIRVFPAGKTERKQLRRAGTAQSSPRLRLASCGAVRTS
jgi:hypothetical protein